LHDDPGDKDRLTASIKLGLKKFGSLPMLIAFEWAHATYEAGVKKRKELCFELQGIHPNLPEDFCRLYADTLAHEPDVHREVIPNANVLWMLDGCSRADILVENDPLPLLVEKAMLVKKTNLDSWLLPKIPEWQHLTADELLYRVNVTYLAESERLESQKDRDPQISRSIKTGRDLHMFNQIKIALSESPEKEGWGIIIVGTAHLADVSGSLFDLCKENFQTVKRLWSHEQKTSC